MTWFQLLYLSELYQNSFVSCLHHWTGCWFITILFQCNKDHRQQSFDPQFAVFAWF
uniref:Inositol phosphorylceramide glucuronosyltransferase 1 n=1 Tax=Rhizophora mucronata TaxID=61149 RepID=A0A2P2LN09_RHIMU